MCVKFRVPGTLLNFQTGSSTNSGTTGGFSVPATTVFCCVCLLLLQAMNTRMLDTRNEVSVFRDIEALFERQDKYYLITTMFYVSYGYVEFRLPDILHLHTQNQNPGK